MTKVFLLLLAALFFSSVTSFAQYNMFLRAIDSSGTLLTGSSTVAGHQKEIELYSESYGQSNPCRTCPTWSSYNVMLKLSASVITMMQMSVEGKLLKSLDIGYRRPGESFDFYRIHMEDVSIESVQESGSTGGDNTPTVSASFAFGKIAYMFTNTSSTGGASLKTKGGWDVVNQVPWSFF